MESSRRDALRNRMPWLITFLLVVLLAVLGTLQYHWLGQAADADRLRTRAALETAVHRFADDFNHQLSRLLIGLRAGRLARDLDRLGPAMAEALQDWRETADYTELVEQLYVLYDNGTHILDPETGSLAPTTDSLDPALAGLLSTLASQLAPTPPAPDSDDDPPKRRGKGDPQRPQFSVLAPGVPALVLPHVEGRGPPSFFDRHRRRGSSAERRRSMQSSQDRERSDDSRDRRRRRRDPRPAAFIVIYLDRAVIVDQILPSLAEQHFGEALPFHLRVVDHGPGDSDSVGTPETLFQWGPSPVEPTESMVGADAEAELFGPLFKNSRRVHARLGRFGEALAMMGHLDSGQWRLIARHPSGSLDIALDKARNRSLAVASGILLVLGAALLLLTRNAVHNRRLARQQLDFVAGITHEIMTPISALRSAGQNLADGLVTESSQISRYGNMIDREGRRLSDLVGQVLAFARMQSQSPRFNTEPVEPSAVVEEVVEQVRSQLEAEHVQLEAELDDGLPWVLADHQALTRALGNLVGNAIKYGQRSPGQGAGWIGLRCRARGSDLIFEVEDRGPGIPSSEHTAIFKPFYRGSDKAGGAIPGSGLGLALVKHLVEAQGGKITLTSKLDHGSTFTIALPSTPVPTHAPGEPAP